MSAFAPRRYQLLAINAILEQVVAGLSAHREDPVLPPKRVRLKAPTGSGKTAILSTVLRRLAIEETSFDLAGIWIAPGRLHEQACASAQQIVEGAVAPILRNVIGTTISQNQILFVNWESLNREEANNFRKENERGEYLQAIVANARAVGRVLVVVIDESHRNIGTAPSMDVLEEIAPAVVIEMSATIGNATYEVGRASVVAEGMIRSEVVANLGVTEGMAGDHRLDLALGKRRELLEAYAARGSNVNPLLIIQIPNGTRGDAELSSLHTELGRRGITELSDRCPDGRLVVWLSDQKSLTDRRDPRLVANDGPIEVLICKEAIAIGWDCPRAQVLYKIRSHSRSETFDVQTVGRIMRTAEPLLGRPIGSTLLDRGYVYHHDTRYEATEDYGLRTAFAHLRDGLLTPQIETSVAVASPVLVQVEHIKEAVEIGLGRLGLLPGGTPRLDLAAIGEAETLAGAIIRDEATVATGGTLVRTLRSRPEISEVFERLTAFWAGGRDEGAWMRDEIYWHTDQLGLTVAPVQAAFIEAANSATAGAEMRRALEEVQVRAGLATIRSEVPFAWSLSLIRDYNAAQDIEDGDGALHQVVADPNGLYAFVPCYLRVRRSQPERRFGDWLAAQSAIVGWWVKNGETPQRDLSLCYMVEGQGEPANFFPDFIVQFRDGVVGVYETKDDTAFSGQDATTNTAKLAALMRFADSHVGIEAAFALVGGGILFYTDPDGDPQSVRSVERRHAVT